MPTASTCVKRAVFTPRPLMPEPQDRSAPNSQPGERQGKRAQGGGDDRQDVSRSGLIVASMTGLSRVSGFIRDVAFAYLFGAGAVADAFFVAFRIPNFFRRLFAEGAFAQAFIPSLATERAQGADAMRAFVARVGGNLAAILALLVVLGVVFADALVAVFAPGFHDEPVRRQLTVELVQITFPYLFFIALVALASALLNSHNRYAIPAITPVLLNIVLITAALVVAPGMDQPVFALAWGVFIAGAVQLLFQIPALARENLLIRPQLGSNAGVRRFGKLLLPAVFASSVGQINALVDTVLASLLITGSISWLYYADRLLELPIGLVAIALGTVLLPTLSRLAADKAMDAFSDTLDWGLRIGVLLGLPAAAALYVLAVPLVTSIFNYGALTQQDVAMAALALQAFAVALLPMVLVKVAAPGFFARSDTTTPFRIGVIAVVVNIVVNLSTFSWFGHVGLAFGTAVSACVNAYLLIRGLVVDGTLRPSRKLGLTIVRALLATAVMVALLAWLVPQDAAWSAFTVAERAVAIGLASLGGVAAYLTVLVLLGLRPRDMRHRA